MPTPRLPTPGRRHAPRIATTTLNVRGIDGGVAARIKAASSARGITIGEYLARLVALHEAMRERADAGDGKLGAELKALGLETIRT